jgi:hypothetical protein
VRIYKRHPKLEWNTYALVAAIELARGQGRNPDVPAWLSEDYSQAIQDFASVAYLEIPKAKNAEAVRAMLSIIALAKGARNHARFLLEYSDDELAEVEKGADVAPD